MSCADVALRTRLDLKVIEAIEHDAQERLPATAFVKGYIRNIARELNVDPAPILALYASSENDEAPPITDFVTRPPQQITSSSAIVRGTTYALIAVFVVLIGLWWRSNYSDLSTKGILDQLGNETAPATEHKEPAVPFAYAYTVVEHPSNPYGPYEDHRFNTDGSPPELPPVLIAENTPAPGITATTTASGPLEPLAAPDRNADLVIETSADAWIQIGDAVKKRLFFGTAKPGQLVTLTGTPPYVLVIGNAPAVQLRFRGQPIDLKPYANLGVARLTLGNSSP